MPVIQMETISAAAGVRMLFDWSETPQGFEYWANAYRRLLSLVGNTETTDDPQAGLEFSAVSRAKLFDLAETIAGAFSWRQASEGDEDEEAAWSFWATVYVNLTELALPHIEDSIKAEYAQNMATHFRGELEGYEVEKSATRPAVM